MDQPKLLLINKFYHDVGPAGGVGRYPGIDIYVRGEGVRVAPRVVVYDPGRALPLAGVPVRVTLARLDGRLPAAARSVSAETSTDELGTATPVLTLPAAELAPHSGALPVVLVLSDLVTGVLHGGEAWSVVQPLPPPTDPPPPPGRGSG